MKVSKKSLDDEGVYLYKMILIYTAVFLNHTPCVDGYLRGQRKALIFYLFAFFEILKNRINANGVATKR